MPLTHHTQSSNTHCAASIHARPTSNGRGLMLEIVGKLSWSQSQVFMAAYENTHQHFDTYMVDMSQCTQVSPSGISALILLKNFVDKHHGQLKLANTHIHLARQIRLADSAGILKNTISIDPDTILPS